MALFFIALIGLGFFFFFLRSLAQVNSAFLVAVLQWTSTSLLAVAFCLFILSGRIAFATILLVIVGLMTGIHRKKAGKKAKRPKVLPPPH